MDKELLKLSEIISKKLPTIVEAIEKEDATSENYNKLLTNFNSSMVVFSEIQTMFAARAAQQIKGTKEEEDNGSNN